VNVVGIKEAGGNPDGFKPPVALGHKFNVFSPVTIHSRCVHGGGGARVVERGMNVTAGSRPHGPRYSTGNHSCLSFTRSSIRVQRPVHAKSNPCPVKPRLAMQGDDESPYDRGFSGLGYTDDEFRLPASCRLTTETPEKLKKTMKACEFLK